MNRYFLSSMLPSGLTSVDFINTVRTAHTILLLPKNSLYSQRMTQWANGHGIHRSYLTQESWPERRLEETVKGSVTAPWYTTPYESELLSSRMWCMSSASNQLIVISSQQSWNQSMNAVMARVTTPSITPFQKICFLFSHLYTC